MRIRRGLSSRHLPCGCVAGIYETYRDEVVTIIDVRGERCAESGHSDGHVVPTAREAITGSSEQDPPRR